MKKRSIAHRISKFEESWLIPELVKSLKLKHQVSSDQISNWLRSLHRFRRSRNNYRIKGRLDSDNRRLHANGHLNEV